MPRRSIAVAVFDLHPERSEGALPSQAFLREVGLPHFVRDVKSKAHDVKRKRMPKTIHARGHDTKHLRIPKNYCFACGMDNPDGMHLKFRYDAQRRRFVGRFRLPRRYQGPPAHAHGGIIATILDEAMGKVNKIRSVIALTSEMDI